MKSIRSRLGGALLFIASASGAATMFEFAGLTLETDLNSLRQRYPLSIFSEGSVWLSPADAHDDIYYIHKSARQGERQLRISFEKPIAVLKQKPSSWSEEHYARFPKCEVVLERLTKAYGQPTRVHTWPEERLSHLVRTWDASTEELSLDCYSIDGKGVLLAAEILIKSK